WEGYLFPDTYEFYTNSSPRSVIAKFIDNFNNKITAEYYERMQELGMTLDELITLASIIQSEAAYMDDMEKVSSAFHNRLAPGSGLPYLQSDVTYFYYTENIEPFVDDEELSDKYLSAYYTYPNYKAGLPVGPICNPGLNAIKAALYPANTNYYYFVTDFDGNFYYAATLSEHETNIIKAGRG
ncbi:MAG: endolytic transglycosylase MltG, partial [Oscillospiraceae bacterium]|nr:endolytic transglycosylase MltG [Oscillospiraceae bacterium]